MESIWQAFLRRKNPAIVVFLVLFLVGVFMVMSLPSVYSSYATILIERQVSSELVPTTVTGKLQERLEVVRQRTLTSDKLLTVAKESGYADLVMDADASADEVVVVDSILENLLIETLDVKVTEDRGGKANSVVVSLEIYFECTSPEVAQSVTEEITSLLLAENRLLRTEQSAQVTSFLRRAETKMLSEIDRIETELAKLREENFENLPEQVEDLRRELARRREELITVAGDISFLTAQKSQLEAKLKVTPKHVITQRQNVINVVQDPRVKLQQARLELELALQNFTENHPDVIQLREQINDIQREMSQSNGASGEEYIAPTNEEYVAISQQLNDVEAKLISAEARKEQVENLMSEYESRSGANPMVGLKYNQLLRDLEKAQGEYADVKSRLYEAELAESLETEERGEKFTLLAPPEVPKEPVKPYRIPLIFFAFSLALAGSGLTVFVAEYRDKTVRSSNDISNITGAKPIGVVPVIDMTNI